MNFKRTNPLMTTPKLPSIIEMVIFEICICIDLSGKTLVLVKDILVCCPPALTLAPGCQPMLCKPSIQSDDRDAPPSGPSL